MSVEQLESALTKKTGIKIINAADYADQEKALIAIQSLNPSKYLKEQYAGNQFYKTLLAVKEGSDEIVGYLNGEKQKLGCFHVYKMHVDSAVTGQENVKIRLFLKAMDTALSFDRKTFLVACETGDLNKYNSNYSVSAESIVQGQTDKTSKFQLESYVYKKALEVLLKKPTIEDFV